MWNVNRPFTSLPKKMLFFLTDDGYYCCNENECCYTEEELHKQWCMWPQPHSRNTFNDIITWTFCHKRYFFFVLGFWVIVGVTSALTSCCCKAMLKRCFGSQDNREARPAYGSITASPSSTQAGANHYPQPAPNAPVSPPKYTQPQVGTMLYCQQNLWMGFFRYLLYTSIVFTPLFHRNHRLTNSWIQRTLLFSVELIYKTFSFTPVAICNKSPKSSSE